jgi:hypothetical protein
VPRVLRERDTLASTRLALPEEERLRASASRA